MIDAIFNPKNIAVIGATEREGSVGRGIIKNIQEGERPVFFVNPNEDYIFGEKCYKKITEIEEKIDLVVIAVPKDFVSLVVDDCIKKEVDGVIIISAGFAETGEEGRKKQEEITEKLKKAGIFLVGPNCLGVIRPTVNLNASFAPTNPKKGEIAFISQSGALIDAVIDGAEKENYGFSLIISVGNAGGLTLTDYIKTAEEDENTKVIALYIEGVVSGREFFETLKKVQKPVVVLKAGKREETKKAISSHTGSLAGEYNIFSSAVKQAGAVEVDSLEEIFDVSRAICWQNNFDKKIGVVTNGGGVGILSVDVLSKNGVIFSELTEKTITKLNDAGFSKIPKNNPLDVLGDALPQRYEDACRIVLEQEDVSGLVVIQTPQIMTNSLENAKRIAKIKEETEKSIITVFMGGSEKVKEAVDFLEKNKIPNYNDPQKLGAVFKALLKIKNKKI